MMDFIGDSDYVDMAIPTSSSTANFVSSQSDMYTPANKLQQWSDDYLGNYNVPPPPRPLMSENATPAQLDVKSTVSKSKPNLPPKRRASLVISKGVYNITRQPDDFNVNTDQRPSEVKRVVEKLNHTTAINSNTLTTSRYVSAQHFQDPTYESARRFSSTFDNGAVNIVGQSRIYDNAARLVDMSRNAQNGVGFDGMAGNSDSASLFDTPPLYTSMRPLFTQQLDELSRKINTLVITVQIQNKKIEEIRRACASGGDAMARLTNHAYNESTGRPISTMPSASVSLQSLRSCPPTFPLSYVVNGKTKETMLKNKRSNTYESFEKIDEQPVTADAGDHQTVKNCKKNKKQNWSFMSCVHQPMSIEK